MDPVDVNGSWISGFAYGVEAEECKPCGLPPTEVDAGGGTELLKRATVVQTVKVCCHFVIDVDTELDQVPCECGACDIAVTREEDQVALVCCVRNANSAGPVGEH